MNSRSRLAAALVVTALTAFTGGQAGTAAATSTTGPAAAPAAGAAASPAWRERVRALATRYVSKGGAPARPSPATSFTPHGVQPDYQGWRSGSGRPTTRSTSLRVARPLQVNETEKAGARGANDTLARAQQIRAFGTRKGANPAALVRGRLSPAAVPRIESQPPNAEDDGDLSRARDTGVGKVRQGFATTGFIGDAKPTPESPDPADDIDVYRLNASANQLVSVNVTATSGTLVPVAVMLDAQGDELDFAFPEDPDSRTVRLQASPRSSGQLYVVVVGVTIIELPSGKVTKTTGDYRFTLTSRAGDRDLYAVSLQKGDVLGVSVSGSANYVSIFDSSGREVHGSPVDASAVYPATTPLPGGGTAVTDHVAARAGRFYVEITSGDGRYSAQVEAYRYGGATKQTQTLFLDVNGQRLNTNIVGGRGVTTLSSLSQFLTRWGLPASSLRPLVAKIKATVVENLRTDLRRAGLSSKVDVKVVTNFDGKDPFGRSGVSRVIIGGTIEQAGIATIGIAQSIDPGNFAREETGLVLLDVLSAAGDRDTRPDSLNSYLTSRSNKIAFIGQAIGNVVSHEAGHFLGNWHTDPTNSKVNLMDAGGSYAQMFGVGPDNVGGTRDDRDVDFTTDRFSPFEGFAGFEDSRARTVWGLSR